MLQKDILKAEIRSISLWLGLQQNYFQSVIKFDLI